MQVTNSPVLSSEALIVMKKVTFTRPVLILAKVTFDEISKYLGKVL